MLYTTLRESCCISPMKILLIRRFVSLIGKLLPSENQMRGQMYRISSRYHGDSLVLINSSVLGRLCAYAKKGHSELVKEIWVNSTLLYYKMI